MATESRLEDRQDPFDPSPSQTVPPRADAARFSFLDWLLVLVRRRSMILFFTLACVVVSLLLAFLLPQEYTATVLVMPPRQNSSLATMFESQLGSLGALAALGGQSLGIRNPNDMFVAMFRSQIVEDAMVRQFQLQHEYHKRLLSKARKSFENHVDVDGTSKDGLIHISVQDRNPQRAAQMANAWVQQFRLLSQRLAASGAGARADFYNQQLQQAKTNLANAEEALKQTELSTGLIELSSQARALIESAASLRAQITAKKVEIQALSTFATGQNSQLFEAEQQLGSLEAQLDKLGGSQQSPNSLIVPKGNVPEAGLEYARRLRDVKYYETIFEILARQYELAKLEQAQEGALIQVISPAIPPDRASFPPRVLFILGGVFGGLFLAALIALCQAGWERLRQDPESGPTIAMIREELRRRHSSSD